jgi:multiple sugar transport system substrate-binding protein
MQLRTRAARLAVAVVAVASVLAGCSSSDTGKPEPKPTSTANSPVRVRFVVYGPQALTDAYKRIAAQYTAAHPTTSVIVQAYPTHTAAMEAVRTATERGDPPDLFQIDRNDLPALTADKAVRRVDDLLAEREVDFGDGYTRSGLEAFSSDSALQCMPSDVSPLVVYYNTRLIDLSRAADPDRRPVTQDTGWTLEEFARVAQLARKPGVRGLYIAPDLLQVAPFVFSGGGKLVDDPDNPTSLALSDDSSTAALQQLLELVRDPAVTFDQEALARRGPVERFKAGRLGMMLGFRDLAPALRQQKGLNFDIMPLPKLSGSATVSSMSALCISAGSTQAQKAADLLTFAVSDDSAAQLAATGYAMPTNLDVLDGDAFLQREQRPLHAGVYERELRHAQALPDSRYWPDVRRAASQQLVPLFYDPVILALVDRLAAIDEASRLIFDPGATPSPSPSASPSTSPSPSPSPGSS